MIKREVQNVTFIWNDRGGKASFPILFQFGLVGQRKCLTKQFKMTVLKHDSTTKWTDQSEALKSITQWVSYAWPIQWGWYPKNNL